MTRHPLAALALALVLSGCGPSPEEQQAAVRAQAEAKVAPYLADFERTLAAGEYVQARRLADVILHDAPQGAAAARVREVLDDLSAKARQQAEQQRLQALWTYQSHLIDGHPTPQRSASLYNQREEGEPRVQLVLRNDPRWGRSVYLVIESGDVGCGRGCAFTVTPEGGNARRFAGDASSTGTHPAFFIEDEAGFIALLTQAPALTLAAADGSGATLRFETGGYDAGRWERGR
jgi:hypothetical protein